MCAGIILVTSWEGTGKRVVFFITVVWRMLSVCERKHQTDANSNRSIAGRMIVRVSSPHIQHFLWSSSSYRVSTCVNMIVPARLKSDCPLVLARL